MNFAAGMRAIERRGEHACIEVGPSASLISLGKRCVTEPGRHRWAASLHRDDPDGVTILRSLSALYTAGITPSWPGFHAGQPGGQEELPSYAFDRKRYWLPVKGRRHARNASADPAAMHHPLLGAETSSPEQLAAGEREFTARITPDLPPWLANHVVMGQVVFPAAGFVEILLAAQDAVYGETGRPLLDVDIHEPLLLGDDQPAEVRTRLRSRAGGGTDAEIVSLAGGARQAVVRRHVTARIGQSGQLAAELAELGEALRRRADDGEPATQARAADELYPELADLGLVRAPVPAHHLAGQARRGRCASPS